MRELGMRTWMTESLLVTALVVAHGEPELAARLIGAAGYAQGPDPAQVTLGAAVRACSAALAGTLGAEPYEAAVRAGAALRPEDAIGAALAALSVRVSGG